MLMLHVMMNLACLLMEPYLEKGHVLYTDNWCTSPLLCNFLYEHNTGSCGTVRMHRKFMAPFKTQPGTPRGTVQLMKSGNLLAVRWHDKRDVNMLTTVHEGKMIDTGKENYMTYQRIMKPDVVQDYTVHMRSVDQSDMQIGSIECLRKSLQWNRKVFLHLMDVSLLNAHNLYRLHQQPGGRSNFRTFYMEVIQGLLQMFGTRSILSVRMRFGRERLKYAKCISEHHPSYLPYSSEARK